MTQTATAPRRRHLRAARHRRRGWRSSCPIVADRGASCWSQAIPSLRRGPRQLPHQRRVLRPPTRAISRFGIRDLLVVHRAQLGVRAAPRGAGRRSASPSSLTHYAPRRLAQGLRLRRRPARGRPRRSCSGCGASSSSPRSSRRRDVPQRHTCWFIPLFAAATFAVGRRQRSSPSAIVLAVMILPIITAISREVFRQTPAAAHGGRAGPRRHPLGDDPDDGAPLRPQRHRSRAAMLGLGRALGETMAVADHPAHVGGGVIAGPVRRRVPLRLEDRLALRSSAEPRCPHRRYIAAGFVLFVSDLPGERRRARAIAGGKVQRMTATDSIAPARWTGRSRSATSAGQRRVDGQVARARSWSPSCVRSIARGAADSGSSCDGASCQGLRRGHHRRPWWTSTP